MERAYELYKQKCVDTGSEIPDNYEGFLMNMYRCTGNEMWLDEFVKCKTAPKSVSAASGQVVSPGVPLHPDKGGKEKIVGLSEKQAELIEGLIAKGTTAYELTLTTTDGDVNYLISSLKKIVRSNMFEVIHYHACIELTQQGQPHIHAVLWTKRKYLDGTKIKAMFKYRYELKRVRLIWNYIKYIFKEYDNINIVNYCKDKKVFQFWSDADEKE